MRALRPSVTISLACALLTVLESGCSKHDTTATAVPAATASSSSPASRPQAVSPAVCAMVTAAQMSTILGTTVGSESTGKATCRYQPAGRSMPYVEVVVDWGNGRIAMTSTRMLARLEPGIADRLAGVGDEASAIGPALMIRTGEDLVTLTMMGVDDNVAIAKRILGVMRPQMGASAQAGQSAKGPGGQREQGGQGQPGSDKDAADAERAAQLVGGMLSQLMDANKGARGSEGVGATSAPKTPTDEPALAPATGAPIRVPLVAGLTLIAAEHEPRRGDYEPIVTVTGVTNETVSTVCSANLPEGNRLNVDRAVRRNDLRQARTFHSWYESGDPLTFPDTTSFSLSAAILNDLRTKGQADFARMGSDRNPLRAIANLVSGAPNAHFRHTGTLRRVEPHAVAFPVLLNEEPVLLHAIHARGTFDDATIEFHVLDDPDNAVILRLAGGSTGRIVRITFPTPDTAAPIEEKLKKDARVELHGIYFDFGKATIRPESESVLRDIASALTRHPDWTINVEGHTDNIGGDASNLDLSRRRADAVKQALVERYRISADTLTTSGFGASRPNGSNDTLSGRARNRRVELVRQ